ncbi:GPI mannosyltransferase 3-like [Copidosoma floridanum]|uniref:GPI mannosyltransferase 3 n=1 Tax=Copidosoma floridanum TaxID=29053 RepID=UPI0006C94340|nr:GPI mannosyltransferase 3 [Copidosoma floridanum]XP_023245182.1 GPI mannosyltransferase 3-like [Copidosoma floridanum]
MYFPRFIRSKIFFLLVVWRILSIFVVQTYHVPDEYWQSLEVAHKLTFGYGYLTWEWLIGIRSYFYPFIFSILYSILKFLNFDNVHLLIYLPRLFHALLSAYAEYKFYIWTESKFALFNLCINWFWYYCASRTLINSFETCLTIIALSEYPWKNNPKRNLKFLWIVGLLCFARPTAAVVWIPLCIYYLFKEKFLFLRYLLIGTICFAISTTIDVICYRKFILTPWEFFKINILNNISAQYGEWQMYWYFTSGLPVILGLNYALLPFAIFKACKNYKSMFKSLILVLTTFWTVGVYSLIPHKEFRFILPVLPMLLYVIHESLLHKKLAKSKRNILIFLLTISNVIPGIFFSYFYQHGAMSVIENLRHDVQTTNSSNINIIFLTNCHATPYYSHLHLNVPMRFLTCEPNLDQRENYYNEADIFFANPMKYLDKIYFKTRSPSHVIVRDYTVNMIEPFLRDYKIIATCPDVYLLDKFIALNRKHNDFHLYKHRLLK